MNRLNVRSQFAFSTVFLCVALLIMSRPLLADIAIGGVRPVTVRVPPTYDPGVPTPLVLLLHGFTASGPIAEAYMKFTPLALSLGFLYAYPDGTLDPDGKRFWNGTDACCDVHQTGVDDSTYLRGLIDEISSQLNVDDRRIFFVGTSNGGFMSHRMACDHADTVAAIASLAGVTFLDPEKCNPSETVHILQIHGADDGCIFYEGTPVPNNCDNSGNPFSGYPGALATAEQWATHNGCSLEAVELEETLDLASEIAGPETRITRYTSDCNLGGSAEIWTIMEAGHGPSLTADGETTIFASRVVDWLFTHPKSPVPQASFTVNLESGEDPLEVEVNAAASTTPAGTNINAYEWDFGDGTTTTGAGAVAIHTFKPGFHTITLTIRTDDGGRIDRATERIFVSLSPGDVAPWTSIDIGDTGLAGAARLEDEDLLVFAGGKAGADNFHFVHQEFADDTMITARIARLSPNEAVSAVGLMFRESLEPGSRQASIFFNQGSTETNMKFIYKSGLLTRTTTSAELEDRWVRIQRLGNEFIGYHSDNGILWTELGCETIELPEVIFGGVAVTAINTSGNEVVLAEVSNLYVGAPPDPRFIRGDGNGDGRVNIADPSFIAGTIFGLSVAPITCEAAADANGDGGVNIADPTYIANFLFGIGTAAPPPAPFPDCALVAAEEPLSCLGTGGCFE